MTVTRRQEVIKKVRDGFAERQLLREQRRIVRLAKSSGAISNIGQIRDFMAKAGLQSHLKNQYGIITVEVAGLVLTYYPTGCLVKRQRSAKKKRSVQHGLFD